MTSTTFFQQNMFHLTVSCCYYKISQSCHHSTIILFPLQLSWSTYVGGRKSCRLKIDEDSDKFSMDRPEGSEVSSLVRSLPVVFPVPIPISLPHLYDLVWKH